jgi:hypothetical protein
MLSGRKEERERTALRKLQEQFLNAVDRMMAFPPEEPALRAWRAVWARSSHSSR